MGGCGSTSSDNEGTNKRKNKMIVSNQMQYQDQQDNHYKSNNNVSKTKKIDSSDPFADKPEIEGDFWYGQGIRRVKAYKCDWTFDILAEKRKEFWKSKVKNKRVWSALKECCEAEHHETSVELLMVAELACVGDNLTHVQDMTTGADFYLPNWVITDPETVIDFSKKAVEVKKADTVLIKIFINNSM